MTNTKISKDFIKWLLFIPLSISIYFFTKLCINFSFLFINKTFVETISLSRGLGEYFIAGSIFILFRESTATGLAIYSGVYLAPKKKKSVYFFFLIVYIFFLIILSFLIGVSLFVGDFQIEEYIRIVVEILAHIIGFSIAGIQIWKELRTNASSKNLQT